MGFGINASVPKVEVPKVPAVPTVPKTPDLAGAVKGAVGAVAGAAAEVAAGAKAAAGGALGAVAKVGASLAGVAGALAEVAISFEGPSVDVAMEPHMVLDANAGFGETKFEKGDVWIRTELPPARAKGSDEVLRLFSGDGSYDEKKPMKGFEGNTERTVDVRFEGAPMDQSFSLEILSAAGRAHTIFRGVPYGDLRRTKGRLE